MIEIIPNWHPLFVHFTVALLMVSFGLFVVTLFVKCEQAVLVAKWNLWLGAGISLLTLAAGLYAYNTVVHDTPSHEAMTNHRNLALITLALLVPVVIWSVRAHRRGRELGTGFVVAFLVVGGMLVTTAWHGGEVVYRYGIGVMSLPKSDSHEHGTNSHGDESANDDHHAESSDGHPHDDEMDDGHTHTDAEINEMSSEHHHDDDHDH